MRRGAALAAAIALAVACGGRNAPPPAVTVRSTGAGATEHECARCHAREVAEWDASLHRASFSDPDFQASFALEPENFCFTCHAPLAKNRADTAGAALGTACVSCHSLAPGHSEGRTTVASTTGCGGCHEFTFPGQPDLMQSTITEHTRSEFAGSSCTSCHMPRGADGHRDHRFDVSRNEAVLRAALDVKTRRTDTGIAVDLATRNVGHAMPTGDLFRRMLVVVHAEDAAGASLGEHEFVLGRRFERLGGWTREREDTRVAGQRTVTLDGEWLTAAKRIAIEVRYERVAQTTDVRDARGGYQRYDKVFGAVTLAEAILDK